MKTEREVQLEKDIKELQDRLVEKTNAYLDCDVKKNKRIRELENSIEIAINHCETQMQMRAILRLALSKNKERYE